MFLSLAKSGNSQEPASQASLVPVVDEQQSRLSPLLRRMKSRIDPIDYRMVLLGSFLPDIIDKPVFLLFGNNASLSGHDYAHTILFSLVLLIGGLILIRYRKFWLLTTSLSSFMHLILDQMWNEPVILVWPLLGPLPKGETAGLVSGILHGLFSCPAVYIPEIIGFVIILLFAYTLVKRKSVLSFIRSGVIN